VAAPPVTVGHKPPAGIRSIVAVLRNRVDLAKPDGSHAKTDAGPARNENEAPNEGEPTEFGRAVGSPACGEVGHNASFLCDEMPIGLEEGIVMTMLRNAGSLKNDKKFNMREIVIDTETTGLDPLRLKQSMRQEHQRTSSYQRRMVIRATAAAVTAESNMNRWVSSVINVERVSRMGRALAMV